MNNAEIVELAHKHMVNIYGCLPLAFVEGRGPYLYDADGNRYLDFFCGLAVTSLGHCHPAVVGAIKSQAEKLIHVSNVFPYRTDGAAGAASVGACSVARRCFLPTPGRRSTKPRSSWRGIGDRSMAAVSRSSR